ncbi:ROK family protein [Pedobacter xixiisoli]|uniref:Glucokinase n=1 Tax=Pedobacter xixiisoli TaxID=1476464 RepID=A0A286A0C6_9SPHI|nr:ROK family protein [Pedobacter xixiisoli]SOD15350.1 glucokinase [Pedobacter xixiisoli]
MGNKKLIGVDIGGSHITAGEINVKNWSVLSETRKRLRVNSHGSFESIIHSWTTFLQDFVSADNSTEVFFGIAMPGPFDYEKGVSYIKGLSKYDSLYGRDIKQALADALSVKPANIMFRNDAEAFLHGEIMHQKLSLNGIILGITLGTGLGSAVSVNGVTRDLFRAIVPMGDGIAEDYISARWFERRFEELTKQKLESVEALVNSGDSESKNQIIEEFSNNLGDFVNDFLKEEQGDVVVIGGNIGKSLSMFESGMSKSIENKDVVILQASLWEDAALVGAGCLWEELFLVQNPQ